MTNRNSSSGDQTSPIALMRSPHELRGPAGRKPGLTRPMMAIVIICITIASPPGMMPAMNSLDILLGDEAVDHQHGGRGQHRAQRAADCDDAGRERLRIVEAPH